MKKKILFIFTITLSMLSCGNLEEQSPYYFDGSISEKTLKNYLNRAVTSSELIVDESFGGDGWYPRRDIDIDIIKQIGAKFLGRSIFRWSNLHYLGDDRFFSLAGENIAELHAYDPEIVVQACVFEAIYRDGVEQVAIPAWVFEAFGQPVESRNFDFDRMSSRGGYFRNHWGENSDVPDVTHLEGKMWLYFQICRYIDIGIEAIHLGQIHLIGMHDNNWGEFKYLIDKVREYASVRARRGYVILDAHTPSFGMIVDGVSLLDFNSMPMRPVEIALEPTKAQLIEGHKDAIYNRSLGAIHPSGWQCDAIPYMVEFDNFGVSSTLGEANDDIFVWGWDEISWFYQLPKDEKREFLHYAQSWIRGGDGQGFLQMPLARVVSTKAGEQTIVGRAAPKSEEIPNGMGIVEIIKEIWDEYPPIR